MNSSNFVNSLSSTKPAYGYLCLLFIPILTILGNTLVILAVIYDKQLSKSVTNRYIAALAFSDFLVGLIPMPLAVYVKVNGEQWNLGVGLCKFYVACDVTSSTASILHLLVISADRYLAIAAPAEYQRYARKAKITFAIVLVWLISITLSIPVVMGKSILNTAACWLENPEYMIYSSLLSFYIPAGVLTLVYVKIFRKIRVRQGIQSMLRAAGPTCVGSEATPFHLPFVVVQEVSFDDQPSSAEKRLSDTVTPSVLAAAVDVNDEPTSTTSIAAPASFSDEDGRGHYQLIRSEEEETRQANSISHSCPINGRDAAWKCRTYPGALKEEGEISFSANEMRKRRSLMYEAATNRSDGLKRRSSDMKWRNYDDSIRLLERTASEKSHGEYKDRAVQTRRRLSLWFHHSCQHIEELATANGACFVLDDNENRDDEFKRAKRNSVAAKGRRILSKAFDSSIGPLKRRQTLTKSRRSSSLILQSASSAIGYKHSFSVEPSGISVSTSIDYRTDVCSSRRRMSSGQADEEESEDDEHTVYGISGSMTKTRTGFNLKRLANRVTNALHRITETQAVTKEKKATKLVALILGIFVISWLPFFTFNTMRGICLSASSTESDCDWLNSQVFFFTSWLGYANSSFNPIIYALVNQHFRRTYKRLLGWPLKRRY